jgi:GT2 family glycosyltransferase
MKWIDRCLSSVYNSSISADVFVIDNGSTDGTIDYIKSNYPKVILHESSENLGFGAANNIGLYFALRNKYEYVYLLNQDAWVEPQTFNILVNASKTHEEYGILSPIQINASGELDKNFAYCCPVEILSDIFKSGIKPLYEVKEVMAAHWLISRKCLLSVGAFSPAFPHYGEDNNFIDRAKYHGFKTGIVTTTKAVHDRECRELSRKQVFYRQYIKAITDYSAVTHESSLLYIVFWQFIKNSLSLHSIVPLKYMALFLKSAFKLRKIKALSVQEQAFLTIKS